MSGTVQRVDGPPVVLGGASGLFAWVLGYLLVFLATSSNIEDSVSQRFIEAVEGEPATHEMVGWVFYNAHFVDTQFTDVALVGSFTTNAIGGENGFPVLLYLIPVVLLLATGFVFARHRRVTDRFTGLKTGLTLVPGYLLVSVLGLLLFEVSIGGASAGPQQLTGVFLCGLVYPTLFGGVGGVAAAGTS